MELIITQDGSEKTEAEIKIMHVRKVDGVERSLVYGKKFGVVCIKRLHGGARVKTFIHGCETLILFNKD